MLLFKHIILIILISIIGRNVVAQTIFSDGDKYGIMDDQSRKIAISPIYDKITECFKQEGFGESADISNHGFILEKDSKYYLVLRQYWETKYFRKKNFSFNQDWGQIDSVSWTITQQSFEDLYPLERIVKNKKISFNQVELFQNDTCLNVYRVFHVLVYKEKGKLGLVTYEKVSRGFGDTKIGEVLTEKRVYSFENIQIHPANYNSINVLVSINHTNTSVRGKDKIVVSRDGKYGIIDLANNSEIEPQFDYIPKEHKIDFDNFYYVKNNGYWGIIYLNKYDNNFHYCPIKIRNKGITFPKP